MKDRVAVPIVMVRDTKELSGYAYVNAVIGLRKVKLLLDTGAADSWVSETRFFRDRYLRSIAEEVPEHEHIMLMGTTGTYQPPEQYIIHTEEFKLENHSFSLRLFVGPIGVHGLDGILGLDLLKKQKAIIDIGAKKLWLKCRV